jgi:hypothetical protein
MTAQWAHVWLVVLHKPAPSVRPVEVATALLLGLFALVLRVLPAHTGPSAGLHEAAIASARWASGPRRPSFRQAAGAVFTGCAVGLFISGSGGIVAGLLTATAALVHSARRGNEREARDRIRLIAAAPPAVDLFAAALASGLLPVDAAEVVATAFTVPDDPWSEDPVAQIARRFLNAALLLRDGSSPELAWRQLAVDDATGPVAAAALRSCRTGAPASLTVAKAARDIWHAAEQAAGAQIRSVAVRATAPLALCFLPAFILVGIVPTALGLLTELQP